MRAVRFRGGSFTREVTGYSHTTNLRHGLTRLIWDIHVQRTSPMGFPSWMFTSLSLRIES